METNIKITPEEVIDRYADMVYRLALVQVKNQADADDIFQEVFIRLVKHIHKLQNWVHIKAWLIRVTINCSKSHFGRVSGGKLLPMEEVEETGALEDGYEKAEGGGPCDTGRTKVATQIPKCCASVLLRGTIHNRNCISYGAKRNDRKIPAVSSKRNAEGNVRRRDCLMREQYQKELSQIHVPAELLEKTKQAMKEEQEKLDSEEKKKAKVISFPKVSAVVAAAVVLLLVVPVASDMLNNSGEQDNKNMQMHLGDQEKPGIQKIEQDKNFIEEIIDAIKDFFE